MAALELLMYDGEFSLDTLSQFILYEGVDSLACCCPGGNCCPTAQSPIHLKAVFTLISGGGPDCESIVDENPYPMDALGGDSSSQTWEYLSLKSTRIGCVGLDFYCSDSGRYRLSAERSVPLGCLHFNDIAATPYYADSISGSCNPFRWVFRMTLDEFGLCEGAVFEIVVDEV